MLDCTFLHLTQKKTLPIVLFAISMVCLFSNSSYITWLYRLCFRVYYFNVCVCILYTCFGVLTSPEREISRSLVQALLYAKVLRGGFLIGFLSQPQKGVNEPLLPNPNWSNRTAVTMLGNAFLYEEIHGT